jgi:hypothetical protein
MGISFGGGSSGGSQQVQLTPEQNELLKTQTAFLKDTAFPAYQKTLGMARDVYGQVNPTATTAANTAMNVAGRAGQLQETAGAGSLLTGLSGLASLFSPQYEQNQIQGALQAGREATREQLGGQNAMYGGAGGLGSARQALADTNLRQLGEQRQATAAAEAQAKVQANKAAAAQQLLSAGQTGLTSAQQSAASRIGYAQAPQDVLGKYASVIFGTPQASTTPNFAGTQGTTGQSSSKGFGFGFGR